MNWLNLEIRFAGERQVAGAESLDVGIWIRLLLHCGKVENGGRITGARLWKSCEWIRVVGITDEEVHREAPGLWKFVGDDLVVEGYPIDQELKVKANRLNGKLGGRPAEQKKPHGKPHGKPGAKRKRNGNGKGTTTNAGDDFGIHPDDLDEYGPAPNSPDPDPHPRWNDFLDDRIAFERFDTYLERTEAGAPARN